MSLTPRKPTRDDIDLSVIVGIGNARLYGLEDELGLTGDQYQLAVSILFVTYCVSWSFLFRRLEASHPTHDLCNVYSHG